MLFQQYIWKIFDDSGSVFNLPKSTQTLHIKQINIGHLRILIENIIKYICNKELPPIFLYIAIYGFTQILCLYLNVTAFVVHIIIILKSRRIIISKGEK